MTLNELNFGKLIELDVEDLEKYGFGDYAINEYHHKAIKGYCTSCEEKGINTCQEAGFCLQNISHGAHSRDFLEALIQKPDTSDWNMDGVMYVMEGPSRDYGIYETTPIEKDGVPYIKRPSKAWYWVHGAMDVEGYPQYFQRGIYGRLVASAIVTFKLANAYMTNLVKCGMNGPKDQYKGIGYYDLQCINNCYSEFLKKEIEILKPKVIFTFGTDVYKYVKSHVGDDITVVGLPHPASRNLKSEYYPVLYFCMMAKWLFKEKIIDADTYSKVMLKFANE